jgi:hypothetical protein
VLFQFSFNVGLVLAENFQGRFHGQVEYGMWFFKSSATALRSLREAILL